MGVPIPLNQVARLRQRCEKINSLYQKDRKSYTYCRSIFLHVDSRSKSHQTDVFFYHAPKSVNGKRLAITMKNTFESKYDRHQPNRGFSGTVSPRNLYVLANSSPAGVFVELGNIQNTFDQRRFVMSSNRQALAKWMMEGFITDYMSVIMYRLKENGRAAVILPDGFLFGTDNAKVAIKTKLFSEFNVHTIIRMPGSVFSPYTSITTNILFFDHTGPTEETWFYRLDMPEGYKHFSKTKPMKLEHFAPAVEWWSDRKEIQLDGFDKSKKYTVQEIKDRNYNIDLCGYPHEEEEILPPKELIQQYQEKRASLNADIDRILAQITEILGIDLDAQD